jgi:hypothetical protein
MLERKGFVITLLYILRSLNNVGSPRYLGMFHCFHYGFIIIVGLVQDPCDTRIGCYGT